MRSAACYNWLSHLILLYLYQKQILKIDVRKTANDFIARKGSTNEQFNLNKFRNIRIDME